MKVFHVEGKELIPLEVKHSAFKFLDGDVYVIDQDSKIWIWIGKYSSVDEGTVAAWVSNKMDQDRKGAPEVVTINQGEEPEEFRSSIEFTIAEGDTPGFLRNVELDMVTYKMFKVHTPKQTSSIDEAQVVEVPLSRSSLKSDDVFIVDGNSQLYCWVGKNANREERFQGQKLLQKLDSERNYLPLQYTIYEGEGTKSEKSFYEALITLSKKKSDVSIEDKRELGYKPERKGMSDKKGFWSKIFRR